MEELESKVDIARRYIEKYLEIYQRTQKQFSKRFVGTVIYNENPDIFKDAEDGRKFVREALGLTGTKSANNKQNLELKDKFAFINEQITDTPNNEPFVMPIAYKHPLMIGDLHGLFYDKKATMTAIEYGVKRGCDSVIIGGDFLDAYHLSRYSKNPSVSAQFLINEREWGTEMLRLLQETFGYVVYKQGNHENRRSAELFQALALHPDLLESASIKDYMFFDGSTINHVEDYRLIKLGKLWVYHGHELGSMGAINMAINTLRRTFDNTASFHNHRRQMDMIKAIDGSMFVAHKIGCLCQLDPRYAPVNNWQNGCMDVEIVSDKGEFIAENKVIFNGKIY